MNGTLSAWFLLICLLAVTAGYLRKRGKNQSWGVNTSVCLIFFACLGYFFTVSKTALLLGETSNRYQLPIYGLLVFLLIYGVWTLAGKLGPGTGAVRGRWILAGVLTLTLALTDAFGLKGGRVFFLYEEEKEIMEFVRAHAGETVVVFYNEASSDNIWRLSDELMEYPRVYLAAQGNEAPLSDKEVLESECILAYVADYENKEACLERLVEENEHLGSWQEVAEKGLWTLYRLS